MPFNVIHAARYSTAVEILFTVTAADEVTLSYKMFWRSEDSIIEVQMNVISGSFALRFDNDNTNIAIFTPSTVDVIRTEVALSVGAHTLKIVSLEAGQMDFIEVYIS